MIESKEKEINGNLYLVSQMTAMKAIRVQSRLMKLLGPAFAEMIVADKKNPDACLPKVVALLVDQLDAETFANLVVELMQNVRRNGQEMKKEIIDIAFAGKLNELFLVLQFVLEVNYADFFQEGGIIHQLKQTNEEETPHKLKKD
jgi:hypothetical protein